MWVVVSCVSSSRVVLESHIEHLQDFIAVVVDDFDGNSSPSGFTQLFTQPVSGSQSQRRLSPRETGVGIYVCGDSQVVHRHTAQELDLPEGV